MKADKRFLTGLSIALAALALNGCGDSSGETSVTTCADIQCEEGQVCNPDTLKCESAPSENLCGGVKCSENQECRDNKCVDIEQNLCGGVKCGENQECRDNQCVDIEQNLCGGEVCKDGQVCKDNQCVDKDPCDGVNCDTGKTCLNAMCIDTACIVDGAEKTCEAGKTCVAGECVDDGCQNMQCGDGETCVKAVCVETLCVGVTCDAGKSCKAGNCIENACLSVTCGSGEVCVGGDCILEACKDVTCTQDKVCGADGTCAFDSAPELVISVVNDDKVTSENGKTAALQVALNHQPASDVVVTITVSNDKEAKAVCDADVCTLTFTADNWNQPQIINIQGLADGLVDENATYSVTLTSTSEDAEFNELTKTVDDFTNENIDSVSVLVNVPDPNITTEAGGSVEIGLSLSEKPAGDVMITVQSDNQNEGKPDVSTVTLTPDNWDQPQKVVVTGVDDKLADGAVEYNIVFGDTSCALDKKFNGLKVPSVKLVNQDDENLSATVTSLNVEVDETGSSADIGVMLNVETTKDITISITSSNEAEAKVDQTSLTFTKDNWNTLQHFTITGVDDSKIDGDQNFTVTLKFEGNEAEDVVISGVNKDTSKADFFISGTETSVTEEGSSIKVAIALTSQPSADVLVKASGSDDTEIAIDGTTDLTFTSDNWNTPQEVTIKGVDDHLVDGDIVSTLVLKAESEDENYNGLSALDAYSVTTVDDDVAEIVVTGEPASLKETGEKATYQVALAAQPLKKVTLNFKISDASELALVDNTPLIFTDKNWNEPQEVTVRSVDDLLSDGNQTAVINMSTVSDDIHFNALKAKSPVYTIVDNETANIVVIASNTTIKAGENNAKISIALASQPTGNVVVSFASSVPSAANVSKSLTFTPDNWNQPQIVGVENSGFTESQVSVTLTITTSSTCEAYNNLSDTVKIKVLAFESQDFKYTGKAELVHLTPGQYKLQVWGASGGDGKGYNQTVGSHAGLGGYSEGKITLDTASDLYVFVGGAGSAGLYGHIQEVGGGFNGGGNASSYDPSAIGSGYGGGGASDIRLGSDSLYARVIVAGGGGGADNYGASIGGGDDGSGGVGGGVNGGDGYYNGVIGSSVGATQTTGYKFGAGAPATGDAGGGGGGWFGGAAGINGNCGGAGGSGFVFTDNADVSSSTIGGNWLLNTQYALEDAKTEAGNHAFESSTGGVETGHAGNGYARISLIPSADDDR